MQHSHTKLRFILVGGLNTSVDFGVFNGLILVAHAQVIVASIISTTVAMVVSYLLNRSFVFKSNSKVRGKEALQFFVVTVVGQWVVQSAVIVLVGGLWGGAWQITEVSKVLAIGASAVWNYLWYSRLVFADKSRGARP